MSPYQRVARYSSGVSDDARCEESKTRRLPPTSLYCALHQRIEKHRVLLLSSNSDVEDELESRREEVVCLRRRARADRDVVPDLRQAEAKLRYFYVSAHHHLLVYCCGRRATNIHICFSGHSSLPVAPPTRVPFIWYWLPNSCLLHESYIACWVLPGLLTVSLDVKTCSLDGRVDKGRVSNLAFVAGTVSER